MIARPDDRPEPSAGASPRQASESILPFVYDELRRLAAQWLARERPGHTLQPTALVHEALLRIAAAPGAARWGSRAHFFAAAALAMRRILVESARRKARLKHGGHRRRLDVELSELSAPAPKDDLVALDEALDALEREDPLKARIVTMRYFGGMTADEVGEVLGVTRVTVQRHWTYARAWLLRRLAPAPGR